MKKQSAFKKSPLIKTIKKNPFLSFVTLGLLAVPVAIDTHLMPSYNMMGSAVNDAMTAIPAIVLASFFYKWNKTRGIMAEKNVLPQTFGELLQKENEEKEDNKNKKDFKPSIAINSFLIIGATVLGHALSNSFYSDMRIDNYPISLHMVKNMSPTIFLSAVVMFGVSNLIVRAKQKIKGYKIEDIKDENSVENNLKVESENTKSDIDKLNNIKRTISNMREKEMVSEVKFKPLT